MVFFQKKKKQHKNSLALMIMEHRRKKTHRTKCILTVLQQARLCTLFPTLNMLFKSVLFLFIYLKQIIYFKNDSEAYYFNNLSIVVSCHLKLV